VDDEIFLTVQKSAVEVLLVKPEEAVPDADLFDDLGATSIARVEILMAVEEALGVRVPRSMDVSDVRTIGDVCALVRSLA
jgi:acyl carrier protein